LLLDARHVTLKPLLVCADTARPDGAEGPDATDGACEPPPDDPDAAGEPPPDDPDAAGELPPDDPDGVCVLPEEDGADGFAAGAAAAPGGGGGFATVTDTGALIAVLNCLDLRLRP